MSAELKLILEIEKYECLYNYKLPEYSRKDVTEKAWSEVAKIAQLSVPDCKEKWRNIRSSLLRSIKTLSSGSKTRKRYYLADSLQFVLPYIKPLNYVDSSCNLLLDDTTTDDVIQNELILTDESENENNRTVNSSNISKFKTSESLPSRKRHISKVNKSFEDKNPRFDETPKHNSMWYFMLSILPEFETMTEAQLRVLKIKILMLIDEMKSNNECSSNPNLTSSFITTHETSSSHSSGVSFKEGNQFSPVNNCNHDADNLLHDLEHNTNEDNV